MHVNDNRSTVGTSRHFSPILDTSLINPPRLIADRFHRRFFWPQHRSERSERVQAPGRRSLLRLLTSEYSGGSRRGDEVPPAGFICPGSPGRREPASVRTA